MIKKLPIIVIMASTIITGAYASGGPSDREEAIRRLEQPQTLSDVQTYALGTWESLAVELRPTEDRRNTGKITPTYLTREFTFLKGDRFLGEITLYGDNYGKIPLMSFNFEGQLHWGNAHPIAPGAWELDFILDEKFAVTPLSQGAADMLNAVPVPGIASFEVDQPNNILGKAFPLFNIAEGQIVSDYDLIYFSNGMLFMGAKHVDGTPFDKPEHRPHQLQVPLKKSLG